MLIASAVLALLAACAIASNSDFKPDPEAFTKVVRDENMTFGQRLALNYDLTNFSYYLESIFIPLTLRMDWTKEMRSALAHPYHSKKDNDSFGPAAMVPMNMLLATKNIFQFEGKYFSEYRGANLFYSLCYMAYSMAMTMNNGYQSSFKIIGAASGAMIAYNAVLKKLAMRYPLLSQPALTCLERIGFDLISIPMLRINDWTNGIPTFDTKTQKVDESLSKEAAKHAIMGVILSRSLINVGVTFGPMYLTDLFTSTLWTQSWLVKKPVLAPLMAHLICIKLAVPLGLAAVPQFNDVCPPYSSAYYYQDDDYCSYPSGYDDDDGKEHFPKLYKTGY